MLDPRWVRDLRLPPLREWIVLCSFIGAVMVTTIGIGLYSARARNIFGRILQAAIVKTTGYEVYVDDTSVDLFPPRLTLDGIIARRRGETPFFSCTRLRVLPGITRSLSGRVALEWLELRSPNLRLSYKNGSFEELAPLLSAGSKGEASKLPFELWGGLITRARVRVNLPGRALIDMRGFNMFAAPRAAGSIPVEMVVPPISIELPKRRVVLEDIHIGLHVRGGNLLQPKRVHLHTFEFISDAGSLQTKGQLDLDRKEGSLSVRTSIDLDIVNLIDPALPQLSGRVGVRAEIDAEKEVPVVNLEIDGTQVSVSGKVIGDMHAELSASSKHVEVKQLQLQAAGGELTATAKLTPAGEHAFEVDLGWQGIELAHILELAGLPEVWVSLRSDGRAKVAGRLQPKANEPTLTGSAHIDVKEFISRDRTWQRTDALPILALRDVAVDIAKLTLFAEHLDLAAAQVKGEPGQIKLDARFNFDTILGFHISGSSDTLNLGRMGRIANVDIQGIGPLSFQLGGPYGPPKIDAKISMADTRISGLPLGHLDSRVLFEDGHTLEFPDAVATLGDSAVTGKGELDFDAGPSLTVNGSLEEGQIKDLLPLIPLPLVLSKSLSGDVGGDFRVSGLAGKPNLDLNFASDAFEVVGQPFETMLGKVSMRQGVFEQMTLSTRIGSGAVELNLKNAVHGIDVQATLSEVPTHELRFLQSARDNLMGSLDGRVDATLGKEQIGEAVATVHKLSIAGRPPQELSAQFWLNDDEIRFIAQTMEGRISVQGKADIGSDPSFELAGSLQRAAIGGMLSMPAEYEVLASGALSLSGPFSSLEGMQGELQLEQLSIDAPTLNAVAKSRATLVLEKKRLAIDAIEIAGRGVDVVLAGNLALDGKMNVGLSGTIDGAVLQPFIPTVEMIVGSVPLDVRLQGPISSPDLRGDAKLDELRMKFSFLDRPFEQLSGSVVLQGNTFAFDKLRARFGDGSIDGSGSVRIEDGEMSNLAFAFDLDDVHYMAPGELPLVLSGRLRVDTNRQKLFELTGDVRIREMRYTYDLNLDSLMPSFKRKPTLTRTLEKSDERVLFDVHLRADDNLVIDNNVAQAEFKADLRLTGTNLRTGLMGTVTPLKATIKFQNNTYTLNSGSIDFVERYQILPRIDLSLQAKACAADLTVSIRGTADNYVLDFRGRDANGAVRQEDIQSCLAFGFRQSEFASMPGVGNAGSASEVLPIGLNLLGSVTGIDRKLKEYFRIDEVRFTAGYTRRVGRGSRVSPRIVVAKDIGAGVKLRLTSSLIEADDQKLELEFPIGDFSTANLSWGNSGDLSNDLGFDLKWHTDF